MVEGLNARAPEREVLVRDMTWKVINGEWYVPLKQAQRIEKSSLSFKECRELADKLELAYVKCSNEAVNPDVPFTSFQDILGYSKAEDKELADLFSVMIEVVGVLRKRGLEK